MNDVQRFYALRRRVFEAIEAIRATGEGGKSYEGTFEIRYDFEECNALDEIEDKPIGVEIVLHCYLLGPARHYSWRGNSLHDALNKCEDDINLWITEAFDG